MKQKIFGILIVAMMLFSFTACSWEDEADVGVDHLADLVALGALSAGIAVGAVLAVKELKEREGKRNASSAIVLMEQDGVGYPPGADHAGQRFGEPFVFLYVGKSHFFLPAILRASPARYDFSSVSGRGASASSAVSIKSSSLFSA